jgi:hypothetical protein
MSDSEMHQIVFERLIESLRDQKRLTKSNLQQQVIACIGARANKSDISKKINA